MPYETSLVNTADLGGHVVVTFSTYSGSSYVLRLAPDRSADTMRRVSAEPTTPEGTVRLRRDDDEVTLLERPVLRILEEAVMVIDLAVPGVPYTVRLTTAITQITVDHIDEAP